MRSLALALVVALALPSWAESGPLAPGGEAGTGPAQLRRFAVVAGANDGGAGRATLRFALEDARSMARVLTDLGGVEPTDLAMLEEPDAETLLGTLKGFGPRMQAAGDAERVELLFYYSGHSDEDGLLLADERVTYREVKEVVDTLPADVRIVVLDSCSSGALTRLKGGVRRAPFLVDASSQVKGHAFLTSSSENEAAQESDRVGGSYFTHFFVSGLRGAADHSGDGKVTLNEAYHYAFQETLRRTEQSAAGPQHASYDIRLAGTGDLVMTDLRASAADLELAADVRGHVLVRAEDGTLLAEIRKVDERPRVLSVPPGAYRVRVEEHGTARGTLVTVAQGERAVVERRALEVLPVEPSVPRGSLATLPQPADPRAVMHLREQGNLMFWGGIGTSAFGVCCMVPAAPALVLMALDVGRDPFGADPSCLAFAGTCTVLSVLFASFGLPLAYTGWGRLEEADALERELSESAAAPEGKARAHARGPTSRSSSLRDGATAY